MVQKLLVLLFLVPYSFALSLDEALEASLKNHPDIALARLQVDALQRDELASGSLLLPQVGLRVSYDPVMTYALPVDGAFKTKEEKSFVTTLSLDQKIYDFGASLDQKRAAGVAKEMSSLSLEDAKNTLTYRTKVLYKQIVITKELLNIKQKDLDLKQIYYDEALKKEQEGLRTKADTSRLYVALMDAKEALATTAGTLDHLIYKLGLFMGRDLVKDTHFDSGVIYDQEELKRSSVDELLLSTKMQLEQKNIEKSDLLYSSNRSSHFGSLDFHASYSHLDTLNSYDATVVGVGYSLPIYTGGKIDAYTQKAKIEAKMAREQKESRLLELQEALDGLFVDLHRLSFSIETKKSSIDASRDALSVMEGRYRAGLSSYVELLDASNTLLASQVGLLEAYYEKSIRVDEIKLLEAKR